MMNGVVLLLAVGVLLVVCSHTVSGTETFTYASLALENGRPVKFCWYEKMRVLKSTRIVNYDKCETCTCTNYGMNCVKYDGPPVFDNNVHCKPIRVECNHIWVMKSNPKKACPDHLIPQEHSAGRK